MMRGLTILVVLAGLAYSAWWFVGRAALLRGLEAGVAQARAEGWVLDWSDLAVRGFPNRLDTGLEDVSLRTPDGAWGLDAPALQVLTLTYRPDRLIVAPATPLTLATPAGPVDVDAETLRASARLTLSVPPQPAEVIVEAAGLTAVAQGTAATVAAGQLSMREAAEPLAYDVFLTLDALSLDGLPEAVPARLDAVLVDAVAAVDRPLTERARLTALTLRRAEATWGDARLSLSGTVTVGPSGTPEGALTVAVDGWRALLPLLDALGLPPAQTALLAAGIGGLETNGRAEIPLTLSNGALRFGALPLAPLPRLPAPYSP